MSTSATAGGSGHDSPDDFGPSSPAAAAAAGVGYAGTSLRDQLYNLRGAANSSNSILPTSSSTTANGRAGGGATSPIPSTRSRANSGNFHGKASQSGKGIAPKIAGAVFCLSVSECSTLFALILFGGAVSLRCVRGPLSTNCNKLTDEVKITFTELELVPRCCPLSHRARHTVWDVSPLLHAAERSESSSPSTQSQADRFETASSTARRTLILTSIPFAIYLFSLYELGDYLSNALGVETGSRTFGRPTCRICYDSS